MLFLYHTHILSEDVPIGFSPAPKRDIARTSSEPGSLNWMITLDGDRLRVETRQAWVRRLNALPAPKVPKGGIQLDLGGSHPTWFPGTGIPVNDGWIQGYDFGEFGGGLYWFSKASPKAVKVSRDNTQLVIRTSKGVFAVQSLDHMVFWFSRLIKVEKVATQWTTRTILDLHLAPTQVIRDGDRFIYATSEFVSTLETDGKQREIYREDIMAEEFSPQSMVRRKNGDLWIGSSRAILRLRPKLGGYAAQWFLPTKPVKPDSD